MMCRRRSDNGIIRVSLLKRVGVRIAFDCRHEFFDQINRNSRVSRVRMRKVSLFIIKRAKCMLIFSLTSGASSIFARSANLPMSWIKAAKATLQDG